MSLFVLNALFDVTHAVLQAAPEVTPASNPDGSPAGSPGIGGFFATALLSLLVVAPAAPAASGTVPSTPPHGKRS